jgi:hypothetical protein
MGQLLLLYPILERLSRGFSKCANTSFIPTPAPQPLPLLETSRRTSWRISPTERSTIDTPTRELTYQKVYRTNPTDARKRLVQTSNQTGNYGETARRCPTSPQRVRKGNQRDQQDGEAGLADQPRPPNANPEKRTPLNKRVLPLHHKTHSGRRRLARHLAQDDEAFLLTVCVVVRPGLGWLYDDHDARGHSGYGMEGRTPYECCVALGFRGSAYVGLMPVVL